MMENPEHIGIGDLIGNYRVVRLLGSGGFARVYLGEHQRLERYAAIKVLHTKLSHEQIVSFQQEARLLAHLDHPHIVRVNDFDVINTFPYLVMDYAPGGTLRQCHPKGCILPLPTVLRYIRQIASALDYAHSQKIIHRDVKPENILIGQQGQLMLSDFGVASTVHSSHSQTTAEMAGTISYIAPEQIQGRPGFASDQYAFGIIVYEWLSGSCPFQGTITEVVTQHLAIQPPPLRGKIPNFPPAVEQVIFTALAKDPAHRFANLQTFVTAFEQACQDHPTSAALNFGVSLADVTPSQPAPQFSALQVSTAPLQPVTQTFSQHSPDGLVQPALPASPSLPSSLSIEQNLPAVTPLPVPIAYPASSTPPSAPLNTPVPSPPRSFRSSFPLATLTRRNMLIAGSTLFLLIILVIGGIWSIPGYFTHSSMSDSHTTKPSGGAGEPVTSTDQALTPASGGSTPQRSAQSPGSQPGSGDVAASPATAVVVPATSTAVVAATAVATQAQPTAPPVAWATATAAAQATATAVAQATATESSCNTHNSVSNPIYQGSGYVYSNGGYYMTKGPYCNGNISIAFTSAPPVSDTQVRVCTAAGTCYGWNTYAGVGIKMIVATGIAAGTSFHLQFQGYNATASETVYVTVYF